MSEPFSSMMWPCPLCGGPKAVVLGVHPTACPHCGASSRLDPALEARLTHHLARIESAIEVLEIDRKKAATTRASARTFPFFMAGLLSFIFGSCAAGQSFGPIGFVGGLLLACGLWVAGVVLTNRFAAATMKTFGDLSATARCVSCGAEVPMVTGAASTPCPFCATPLAVSQASGERLEAEADRAVAVAESDIEAANREFENANRWASGPSRDRPHAGASRGRPTGEGR